MNRTLGERLRSARKARGLTQRELANMADTTQDVIQKIENGVIKMPRNIKKIAESVGRSPAWLQFGIDEIETLDSRALVMALKFAELTDEQQAIISVMIEQLRKK